MRGRHHRHADGDSSPRPSAWCRHDIKNVLAYSTVSQLGYMFMACGVAAYSAGIFHLMTHAFFKALLFLGAGSVIHGLGGEQDMRKMGGLRKYMPYTFWTMTVGNVRHRRASAASRLLLERRDSLAGLRAARAASDPLADRRHHRGHDLVLHVPAVVPDVLR